MMIFVVVMSVCRCASPSVSLSIRMFSIALSLTLLSVNLPISILFLYYIRRPDDLPYIYIYICWETITMAGGQKESMDFITNTREDVQEIVDLYNVLCALSVLKAFGTVFNF